MTTPRDPHFKHIFWYIAALTAFGAAFSIYLIHHFSGDVAARFADVALIFWLSTGVGGGIGYLLGASASRTQANPPANAPGQTTAQITADITTTTTPEVKPGEKKS